MNGKPKNKLAFLLVFRAVGCDLKILCPQKLREWVELKEFDNQKKLNKTIFSFVHSAITYSFVLILRGDSYIKHEIENDVSLRHSLEIEAGNWATLLSNKLKIGCLLSVDTMNGKMRQRQENKSSVVITEVEENKMDIISRRGRKRPFIDTWES